MKKKRNTKFSLSLFDSMIVIVCTIGIIVSMGFFIKDMNISLVSDEQTPIGVVYYKKNTAQRRLINRNLWERVKDSTPVYNGDRIRTGNLSEAYLVLSDGTEIDLYENTLIQIYNDGRNSLDFVNGSMAIVAGTSDNGSGETITVKTGDKVLALSENTSALISKEVQKDSSVEKETVVAVSSGEVYVKPLDEKTAAKGNNTALYETIEAGSVAEVVSVEKTVKPETTEKQDIIVKKEIQKDEFKVVMPGQSYTANQNKDEIKFVPFFWTEEKDVRVEFAETSDFNKVIDTEYLSSETHKGSVSLDFAKNGQILYWRVLPAKEKVDSQKTYPTGKIIVRSDEAKQQELKEAVSLVFGEEAAEKITEQVQENTKTIDKNEAIAMSDIKPAVSSEKPKNPVVSERKPIQTIENYIQEKIEQGFIQPIIKDKSEDKITKTEEPDKTLVVEKITEKEKTAEIEKNQPVENTVAAENLKVEENKTVVAEKTESPVVTKPAKPVFPIKKRPKKTVTTKPSTSVEKTETKPAVSKTEEVSVENKKDEVVETVSENKTEVTVENKNEKAEEIPAENVKTENNVEEIKTEEPKLENSDLAETKETGKEEVSETVTDKVVSESSEKPAEIEKDETVEPPVVIEKVPEIPALVEMTPDLKNPSGGRKFTEVDFESMDEPFIEFEWNSIEGAQAYKFVIKNEAGAVIWTTTVRTNRYVLKDRIDLISDDGTYVWEVTAVTKENEEVYTSKTAVRTFRIEMDSPETVTNVSGEKLITIE